MSNIGLLFPGQGSQAVGMGKELYDNIPEARRIMDESNDILGFDIKSAIFEGNEEELCNTEIAQSAIYIVSAMYYEKYKLIEEPFEMAAGHSIGEYAALYACNVFSFEEGLRLVRQRGIAMSKNNYEGVMFAVMGIGKEELEKCLEETKGNTVIANINSKTQIIISGATEKTVKIADKLSEIEGIKVKRLKVSGAFHSPMMEEAQKTMMEKIDTVKFNVPNAFVIPNLTAKPTKDENEIKRCLKHQITGCVNWLDTILQMKNAGIEKLYEVGHGDVLKKINKSITMRPKCISVL